MLELITDPLYREALVTAMVAGLSLGLLGVYVVSRRMVFISAALTQTAALGVTVAFIAIGYFGWAGVVLDLLPPAAGIGLSFVVVAALLYAEEIPRLSRDAILGIGFIVPMALVFLLLPLFPHELHEVEAVIDGTAVMVQPVEMYSVVVATVAVVVVQIYAFRGFVFASLDPVVAQTQGVPVRLLNGVLFGAIALMTALATRALGPLSTFGLTVLPAIGALGLTIGLKWVFVVAAVSGATSGVVGYYFAYQFDWSVGATQALTAAAVALLLRAVGYVHRRFGAQPSPPTSG